MQHAACSEASNHQKMVLLGSELPDSNDVAPRLRGHWRREEADPYMRRWAGGLGQEGVELAAQPVDLVSQSLRAWKAAVEDVFSIEGRGTVATGRIEQGIVHVGDKVEILGLRDTQETTLSRLCVSAWLKVLWEVCSRLSEGFPT